MPEHVKTVTSGGRTTAYRETGSGEPLVFVHGVGSNKDSWLPQLEHFAASHRVIRYDTLGHGASDLPPEPAALDDYVAQLLGLLDGLDLAAANLVGTSMGGMIVTAFGVAHPGRVLRLVSMNAVYDRTPEARAAAVGRAEAAATEGPGASLDEAIKRWFGDPPDPAMAEAIAETRAAAANRDPVGYARAYMVFAKSDQACVGKLHRLDRPALFFTGEFDLHSTPAMSRAMADATPRGRCVVLPGERHLMARLAPDAVNAVLADFLRDQLAPDASD